MEVIHARPNSQNDPMGECRSFSNNYFPPSQSRKMSIGIMVDSAVTKEVGTTKEDQVSAPNAGMKNSIKENSVGAKTHERGAIDANEEKQTEAPEHVSSPWITPRSVYQKASNTETVLPVKKPSNLASTKGRWGKLGGTKGANADHAVQYLSNQSLHSGNVNQKSDLFTGKSKDGKGGSSRMEKEFIFATDQVGLVSDKVVMEDKTEERRTETLRMKLCEILGTISSPKSQPSNSQAHDAGAKTLKAAQISEQKDDAAFKPRQQSDSIEPDSESPDCTLKRPVTRSLTRKRTSTKKPSENTKADPSSTCKENFQKNIHSEKGLLGKGHVSENGGSLLFMKRGQGKSSSIKPRKICFTNDNNVKNVPGETHRSGTSSATVKTSSAGDKTGSFPGFDPQNEKECTRLNQKNQEIDSDPSSGRNSVQSPGTPRTDQFGVHSSPTRPDNRDQQEDPINHFESPVLKMNTPISSLSPCSTPKTKQKNQNASSPEKAERIFSASIVRSFRSLQNSKAKSSASNAQTESLDNGAEPNDSFPTKQPYLQEEHDVDVCLSESSSEDEDPASSKEGSPTNEVDLPTKPSFAKKQKDAEVSLFEPSCEDQDSDSSRESSPILDGGRETDTFSPQAATKGSEFMLYPNKKCRVQRGNKIDEFSPPLVSAKGTGESDWIPHPEPSGQTQEDDLQRVIMLFALALRNFKNKMISATKRKSSEILMSVSEEIQQQLRNIESQIVTDVGKLTSLSRSKRKRLEGRFQEQQEQLKLIHDKFKTDIHQHLQDCKSTLEGLEVNQAELKGAMKNQKASHQKLLLQAEEAIETKLSDAERRITGVHKSAEAKMLQLRHAIAECLNEGGSS